MITQCNKNGKWVHDRIDRCFGCLHAEADPDGGILNSAEEDEWGMKENVEFCTLSGSNLLIGASFRSLVGNHMW